MPDLYRHLAACDLAVVQGGLTTTMELAADRPAVPLRPAAEPLRAELPRARTGWTGTAPAGCLDYDETTPEPLAAAIAAEIGRPTVDYRPVETDGAARAAKRIAELI